MSEFRDHVRVLIDPEQSDILASGALRQDISVILVDGASDHERPDREPVLCTLRPGEARELAFELLSLAEAAEREEAPR